MSYNSEGVWSCGDTCRLSKSTPALVAVYLAQYDFTIDQIFWCGHCTNNDSWVISEMLWDNENEFLVTPCCHTEAKYALEPDEVIENDYDNQREEYENYVYSVTGR